MSRPSPPGAAAHETDRGRPPAAPPAAAPQAAPLTAPAFAVHPDDPTRPSAPWLLRAAAGWSWRILIVAAAVYLLLLVVIQLRVLALAMTAALLLSALLHPVFRRLHGLGLPRAAAAALTLLGLLGVIVGIFTFVSSSTISEFPRLQASVSGGVTEVRNWLVNGPIGLDPAQIDKFRASLAGQLAHNRQRLTTGAISGATVALELATGALLMLFSTFFFLYDGPRIWGWIGGLFTPATRPAVRGAGEVAWAMITGYIRGTVLVATFDAIFIGLALLIVGVPLVVPLALLTFLGAFIPIAGATIAGIAAILVALVAQGPAAAIIIALAVLAVQQIEGHVLQPLVLGRSVHLHPLAIVMSITAGATLAGVPGAVVAVPLVAALNRMAGYLLGLRHGETVGEAERRAEEQPVGI